MENVFKHSWSNSLFRSPPSCDKAGVHHWTDSLTCGLQRRFLHFQTHGKFVKLTPALKKVSKILVVLSRLVDWLGGLPRLQDVFVHPHLLGGVPLSEQNLDLGVVLPVWELLWRNKIMCDSVNPHLYIHLSRAKLPPAVTVASIYTTSRHMGSHTWNIVSVKSKLARHGMKGPLPNPIVNFKTT